MNILREAHRTPYMVHLGETKMYQDMRQSFWWKCMKVDIAKYVASCGIYQKVKAEHKRPAGLLKPLEIPEWKWENIAMDIMVGLPHSPRGKDAIWVVIDRLTKVVHFIPMKQTSLAADLVSLYMKEVVRLYGLPKSIVSVEILNVYPNSGKVCITLWEPSWICVLPFILKQTDSLSILYRP
jgi:hypothetical protein